MRSSLLPIVVPMLLLTSESSAQAAKLGRFLGKDLRKLSTAQTQPLYEALGEEEPVIWTGTTTFPWYFWKTTNLGRPRYILLKGKGLLTVPDDSYASITLYDASLNKIDTWFFSTGHRINLLGASFRHSRDLDANLIMLKTQPPWKGGRGGVARQYFAFSGDRLRFIRMEDPSGELLQNHYFSNRVLGVGPEASTADQWVNQLRSPNKADQLSALVFLGGDHRHGDWRPGSPDYPQPGHILKLLDDPRIRETIQRLRDSPNLWLKQAADLAALHLKTIQK